ncbi:hypothetical protein [Pseudophaeobacter flagellatus]|uniref:hypothetical protein n=1 Tax=Pseudophaeobacter flagellatus TaxID=2899119 RepID=UPI001E321BCF|nr:hypothetical protein [Pseudophaeobacter flagellatus]MCD9147669.1 hypothetical protein [Pseudophaeobacter flagellatus]
MSGRILKSVSGGLLLLALAACDTVPVEAPLQVSGAPGANFNSDEAQCRAEARRVGQGHIGKTAAVAGTGGALVGATESRDKALAGALVGAAVGAAVADSQVKQAQRQYLVQCMQQRGHSVTG